MVMAPTCGAPQEARVRVIVALGAFAWDAALRAVAPGGATPIPRSPDRDRSSGTARRRSPGHTS